MKLDRYLDFITETAFLAGRLTLGHFQTGIQPEFKSDFSPVTIADRLSEEFIRSRIEKAFPHHAIIGEEYGSLECERHASSHRWIIDPLDGTKSFIRGIPLFATLIGLEIDGKAEVGAAYFPALDEMIAAANGSGCWWNGRRAHVSQVANLNQAVFTTTSTQYFRKYNCLPVFERLAQKCYFQTGWGDAYGYLLVATGRAEIMMDPVMHIWDCAPFPPILNEAGGYFGDWQGNSTIYSSQTLSTNRALLTQVLDLIQNKNPLEGG